jgi:hypothetical protein
MAQKTAPKSYATDLEQSVLAALGALSDARFAVSMLKRHPELGFAFDPAAFDTELSNARGELELVHRMVKAARGAGATATRNNRKD